jgi:hypothetical protein
MNEPPRGMRITAYAGLALVFWTMTGVVFYWGYGGLGMWVLPLVWAGLLSFLVGLIAVGVAARHADWIAAACLGIITGLGLLAADAAWHNGHPEPRISTPIYGYTPQDFSLHPFALPGSIILIVLIPLSVLGYGLAEEHTWLRQALTVGGVIAALAVVIALRQ